MTPRQAIEGIVELGLPSDGRVLVSFAADVAGDPDLENEVLIAMLAAGESQDEVSGGHRARRRIRAARRRL